MEEEEKVHAEEEIPVKSTLQVVKESWYDHLNVTVKQLDIIIGVCLTALALILGYLVLVAIGIL